MADSTPKILVLGAAGMLGHKLYQQLGRTLDVVGTLRSSFETVERFGIFQRERIVENVNVADPRSLEFAIETVQPDVVINAVGIVKQVPSAKDAITTLEINSVLPHRLALLGEKCGFRLITISTDCVFDGERGDYNEEDRPNALDLYGKSKHLGEVTSANCLTIRTSIIGRELATSHSLVEWFLSNRGGSVSGYATAIYSGFPTIVFADILISLIVEHKELTGLWHVASEPINKFELLGLVNRHYDANIEVSSSDGWKIDRSLDGSRFNRETKFVPPGWDEMVRQMANDPTEYELLRT